MPGYMRGVFAGANGNEETAALGLLAGINAARCALRPPPVIIGREAGYIGTLVDDVARGEGLPYRMPNAWVTDRTQIRNDNADLRLTPLAGQLGLVDRSWVAAVEQKRAELEVVVAALRRLRVFPSAATNRRLASAGIAPLSAEMTAEWLLRRPTVSYAQLQRALDLPEVLPAVAALVEITIRYEHTGRRRQTAHAASDSKVLEASQGETGQ